MARQQGYAVITGPDGVTELRTSTCAHCQHLTHMHAGQRAADLGGHCRICDKDICGRCVDLGSCTPWEEQMRRMEARQDALRSYGISP